MRTNLRTEFETNPRGNELDIEAQYEAGQERALSELRSLKEDITSGRFSPIANIRPWDQPARLRTAADALDGMLADHDKLSEDSSYRLSESKHASARLAMLALRATAESAEAYWTARDAGKGEVMEGAEKATEINFEGFLKPALRGM